MQQFLEHIYNDFKFEQDYWCNIPKSQFSNSKYRKYDNKQYSKKYIEQYYLLKYAPLYFEEYYEIYYRFLNLYKQENIQILSIGVGAGLDFFGFTEAIVYLDKNINIDYVGIDIVDWYYRFDNIKFLQKSLEDFTYDDLNNFAYGQANVLIFPKSIIEIDAVVIKQFANLLVKSLENILFYNRELWFLVSYIKTDDKISGLDKFKIIYDILLENGFKLKYGNINKVQYSINKDLKILYPIDYQNTWMKDIKNHCDSKCNQLQINRCNLVNQYPMLYKKHIAYGIYHFIR